MLIDDSVEQCLCEKGFEPGYLQDGVACFGIYRRIIIPCNYYFEPRCLCTGNVIAILTDYTGTWCLKIKNGLDIKLDCENRDEWEEYNTRKGKLTVYEE